MAADASRVESIFFAVLDISAPQDRIAYLDRECGGDMELRRHVERLLEAHPKLGDFLNVHAAELALTESKAIVEGAGTIIGRYKLLQRIGEGGFGIVFMAEQQEPVVRKVALKIIKPGMDTREVVARFEAERQALALMDHPHIARVLDAGATDSGRPYFVMELVRGVPITEYCDRNGLSTEERLKLFATICRAVQHAHQKGIIHRDLKPSNILVTLHDGHPVPKVIDFGVSKAIAQRLTEKTLFTAYGQMIGTPQYMSPEQAEMSGLDVDTRSDVYSLGVLLYELLTGTTPLDANRLRSAAYAEMQRIIREEDPPKPSVRLSTLGDQLTVVANHRNVDGKRLRQLIRGELDWIVMKSLEKERGRRYDSANSLAADVDRFLKGEPVEAHPPSAAYQVRKFARRYRAPVLVALSVLTALLLGTVGTTIGLFRAAAATATLEDTLSELERTHDRTVAARNAADEARIAADEARSRLESHVYTLRMSAAFEAWENGDRVRLQELLNQCRPQHDERQRASFEWRFLMSRYQEEEPAKVLPFGEVVDGLAFSPDGQYVAMGLGTGAVELYDWNANQRIQLFVPEEGSVNKGAHCAVGFSADGRWLVASGNAVAATRSDTGKVAHHPLLWQLPSRELTVLPVTHDAPITWVTVSPDGRLGASVSRDGVARVWSVPEGTVRWVSGEGSASDKGSLAFWPNTDRHVLALAGAEGLELWDMDTGQLLDRRDTEAGVSEIAFSQYGRLMATSDSTATRLWNVEVDTLRGGTRITHERNACLAFLPGSDGDILVAAGADNWMVKLWDVQRGRQIARYVQRGWPQDVAISPDGNWVVSAALPDVVRLWDLRARRMDQCAAQPTNWPPMAVSPDNRTVAAAAADGHLLLWDTLTDTTVELPGHEQTIVALAYSRSGETIASTDDKTVKVWSVVDRRVLRTFDGSGARSVAMSPDGKWLAASFTGKITLWDLQSGASQEVEASGRVACLAFSPDSQYLISGGQSETVIWKVRGRTLMRTTDIPGWRGNIRAISCSPDGTTLAVPGEEAIGFWDWEGRRRGEFPFGSAYPSAVAYSPDGATVVATGPAGVVKFWQVASGEEVGSFRIEGVRNVAIFPDGHAMVTASMNGNLRVWRVSSPDVGGGLGGGQLEGARRAIPR